MAVVAMFVTVTIADVRGLRGGRERSSAKAPSSKEEGVYKTAALSLSGTDTTTTTIPRFHTEPHKTTEEEVETPRQCFLACKAAGPTRATAVPP